METLLPIIQALIIPVIGGVIYYINTLNTAQNKELDRMSTEMNAMRNNVNAWQLQIVQTYATKAELERIESKIIGAIEKLDNRLERALAAASPYKTYPRADTNDH